MGDSGANADRDFRFITNTPRNALRIPEELWEDLKPIIIELYVTKNETLDSVMAYMKENHNFNATKRQYIHRLGKEKWNIKKYKTGNGNTGSDTPERPPPAGKRIRKPLTSRIAQGNGNTSPATEAGPSGQPQSSSNMMVPASIRHPPAGPSPGPGPGPVAQQPRPPWTAPSSDDQQKQNLGPYQLDMTLRNALFWYKTLADMLYALGDHQSAFDIYLALLQHFIRLRPTDEEAKPAELPLALACARTAQTRWQVDGVHSIIERAINDFSEPRDSSGELLYSAQAAQYYYQRGEDVNGSEQFSDLVDKYIDTATSQLLAQLTPRSPKLDSTGDPYQLDTTVYQYLYRALQCFNNDAGNFLEGEGAEPVDISNILEQFLQQQPAFANGVLFRESTQESNDHILSRISCLRECLQWCIDTLEKIPRLPDDLNAISGPMMYKITCMLWRDWVQSVHQYQGTYEQPWWDLSPPQLDKSASELLTIVVSMIMATEPEENHYHPQPDIISNTLLRARALHSSRPRDLLDHFLYQIRKTSEQHMAVPIYGEHSLASLSEFRRFRDFVGRCVAPPLPYLPDEAVIHRPTTPAADPDNEDAMSPGCTQPHAMHLGHVQHLVLLAAPSPFQTVSRLPSLMDPELENYQFGQVD